jgi:hypothetical protein
MTNHLVEFKRVMGPLLSGGRYRITGERYYPQAFGNALLTLEGDRIRIRLASDRSQVMGTVSPVTPPEQWWHLRPVLAHLDPSSDANLGEWPSAEDLARSIERNLVGLEQLVGSRDPALATLLRAS